MTLKLTFLILAAAAAFTLTAQQPPQRFGPGLDFFAAMNGDEAAFQRGMAATEKLIAENPNHPDALVWHGIGTTLLGGKEFEKGNPQKAMEMMQKGLAEMEAATKFAPDNPAVRIPRGAALKEMVRDMPPQMATPLLEAARTDYQRVFDLQQSRLDQIPKPHPLGELLQGLGDIYSRQGKADEAAKFYGMISEKLPNTEYAKRAAEWMKTRQPLAGEKAGCVGCHVYSR